MTSEREYVVTSEFWARYHKELEVANRVLRDHGLQIVFDVRTAGSDGLVHVLSRVAPYITGEDDE